MALAVAVTYKLADFALFVGYLAAVTGWSSPVSSVLAIAVVAGEVAVLTLGLRRGSLSHAAALGAGLFLVFVIFHLVRSSLGDPLPCACFGSALQWPPQLFAILDAFLLATCIGVYRATRIVVEPTTAPWNLRLLWTFAFLALAGLEVRVLWPHAATLGVEAGRFDPLRTADLLSTTGVVHRASNMRRIIFVFGDYECPFSRDLIASPEWQSLQRDPETTLMWKELPLVRLHPDAMRLALLSKAAALQGGLYEFGTAALSGRFDGRSAEVRLAKLPAQTREIAELEVQDDLRLAEALRLNRTPTIILVDAKGAREISSLKGYDRL